MLKTWNFRWAAKLEKNIRIQREISPLYRDQKPSSDSDYDKKLGRKNKAESWWVGAKNRPKEPGPV